MHLFYLLLIFLFMHFYDFYKFETKECYFKLWVPLQSICTFWQINCVVMELELWLSFSYFGWKPMFKIGLWIIFINNYYFQVNAKRNFTFVNKFAFGTKNIRMDFRWWCTIVTLGSIEFAFQRVLLLNVLLILIQIKVVTSIILISFC